MDVTHVAAPYLLRKPYALPPPHTHQPPQTHTENAVGTILQGRLPDPGLKEKWSFPGKEEAPE